MPKRGGKKQQSAMSNSIEELMRMLVEERAQRESVFAQREREVQAQMTTMQQHMESLLRVARTSPVVQQLEPHQLITMLM